MYQHGAKTRGPLRPWLRRAAVVFPCALLALANTLGAQKPAPGAAPVGAGAGAARTVNDSLDFDWATLDGVSLYAEDNDHTRTRRMSTQYAITRDANGMTVLERHVSIALNEGYKDQYVDEWKTVLDGSRNSHEYYQRTSWNPSMASGFSWEASTTEGEWRFGASDGRKNAATLAVGALPPELEYAAVAALPDSLPSSAYIWFFGWDSTLALGVKPVRFDFGERAELELPVATAGQACGPKAPVERRKVPIVWVTVTDEATRSVGPILATRPHLRFDPKVTKCMSAPSLRSTP